MELRWGVILLLFGILGGTLVETRETPDTIQKVRDDISTLETRVNEIIETLISVEERLSRSENIQCSTPEETRTSENSVANTQTNCASSNSVSRLTEDLQNLDKFTKTELQSIKSEVLPRLKQLEEKCAASDDAIKLPDVQNHFDATFTLQDFYGQMTCYSDDNYENLQFSLALDTGRGAQLPAYVNYTKSPEGKYAVIHTRDIGVYECKSEGSMNIVTIARSHGGDTYANPIYKVASIGEDVELSAAVRNSQGLPIRWKHNGADLRDWDEKMDVTIPSVQVADAGIYECFYEGRRDADHAIFRLIVRKCRENFYGKDCDLSCPPCFNGGVCHEEWGVCICPAGFTGTNCEVACGEGRFGINCTKSCQGSRQEELCRGYYFCKPDPLGCTCAPGYFGHGCYNRCNEPGTFGADCKQRCHCTIGGCNHFTGACNIGGCSPGWTGDTCQIEDPYDETLTLQNSFGKGTITCYSDGSYENLQFSLSLDTGKGAKIPASVNYTKNPEGKYATMYVDDPGVYECKAEGSTKIVTVRPDSGGDIHTNNMYKVANIGEDVELSARILNSKDLPIRWKHNGDDVRDWDGKLEVTISSVELADAGIYECFYDGRREASHAIIRLIVRKCKERYYGTHCGELCTPCYNGGVCHEDWAACICPAGFTGKNCEVACGKGRFGLNCTKSCEGRRGKEDCRGYFFCKPDPVGCACAPGYFGHTCSENCDPGWYGADCKQPCHCKVGTCNRFTGACSTGGCSPGWRGNSCQIPGH